jgi:TolB-like protein/Tfp pilus assembly protein PilF
LSFVTDTVTSVSHTVGASMLSRPTRNKLLMAVAAVLIVSTGGLSAYFLTDRRRAIESVAVMPFVNAGADREMEYLADGLTESIINNLSQLSELKVVPRSSVFRYKGKNVDPLTVARELNVPAVLTGRLEQRGDSLTISLELVDVRENRQLWGERFTRPISEILQVQIEISQKISEKLRLRLEGKEKERLARLETDNPEAYQLYLRGRYHWDKWIPADVRKSILYFEKAINLDPGFALAYTGLADAYTALNGLGAAPSKEVMPKAKAAVERALDLNPALSEAYTARGMIRHFYDWDFAGGDQDFVRAITLKPNSASAHHLYAKNLPDTGRFDEAVAEFKRALELDPYSVGINKDFGEILFYARQYDQAIAQWRKTLELEPNYIIAYYWLGRVYEVQGVHDLSVEAYLKSRGSSPSQQETTAALKDVYEKHGWKGFSQMELEGAKSRAERSHFEPYYMVLLHLRNGNKEQALQWLEKAYESRSSWIPTITYDPLLDSLRSDPRFQELVRRAGLSD